MTNKYVDFITDDDFLGCVEYLIQKYIEALQGVDYDKFFKNRIDTFKMSFDKKIYNLSEENWLAIELRRQTDKSVTNHVGKFHEKLIGCVPGYSARPVGDSYDIIKDDRLIFAEIKNKHNTLTGTHVASLFNKIKSYAEKFPEAECYYVRIIDLKSQNQIWNFTSGGKAYSHPRIHIISGDLFWDMITERENSFKAIMDATPSAINDYLQNVDYEPGSSMALYAELYQKAIENNRTIFDEIIELNFKDFSGYVGWK